MGVLQCKNLSERGKGKQNGESYLTSLMLPKNCSCLKIAMDFEFAVIIRCFKDLEKNKF